jgi:hypothetical protein
MQPLKLRHGSREHRELDLYQSIHPVLQQR